MSFLYKQDLIRDEKITNAAFLLFTERDTRMTTIEMGRFQTDILIKDSLRSQSDIISQVNQVIDFVKKHMNKAIIITGQAQNTQQWQYPLEAIREIVMNMIVHRDYRDTADSIIKIYDDKIEFFNPGKLPDAITEDDLLTNSYKSTPRNKTIADIFRTMGLIEKYGSGIQRIINYFMEAGLPKPSFKNQSSGFLVTIYSNVTENVTENRIQAIIDLIKKNPKLTTTAMSNQLNITRMTLHRELEKLKEKGILKRIGPDKGGHWEIKEN